MKTVDLIKKLTLTPGVSGFEREIREIMKCELKGLAPYKTDNLGSITFEFKGKGDKPKIMFIAHMDEVGFIVSDILENGFIKPQRAGSWDPNTLPSSPVEVINSKGEKHPGVINSTPVYLMKESDEKLDIDKLFIDIGASSRQELIEDFGIQPGDQIVPVTNFHYNEKNGIIFSKAYDDRLGVAAAIELGKRLARIEHDNTIYCVGSVQEEVGTRGAKLIAKNTAADICFVLEGAPADDLPGVPFNSQIAVGMGAHVRLYDPSMIPHQGLKNFVSHIAATHDIKVQYAFRRSGGTDGREIMYGNGGIPSIVLGVPSRYAHSHNCVMSTHDFDELIKLLEAIVENLNQKVLTDILNFS